MQRQRDRDRDRMPHYWEARERDSRRSRSRSRSRERRRGWDDTGDYEQQHHHLQPPPPRQHFAGAGLGNSAFELYVGGFRPGQVTEVMLAELFSQILGQCDGFSPFELMADCWRSVQEWEGGVHSSQQKIKVTTFG